MKFKVTIQYHVVDAFGRKKTTKSKCFVTDKIKVARHYAALNSDLAPVITDDRDIVWPLKPLKVKKWQSKSRACDTRTYNTWTAGDEVQLGLRGTAWGYYFKGFWHGCFITAEHAVLAWRKRPVVGNQGIVVDATEPMSLDDLDMAMF